MHRQLVGADIEPTTADFQMVAAGPLFAEQTNFDDHRPFRDRMAAMEQELVRRLRECGWEVVGGHRSKHMVGEQDK